MVLDVPEPFLWTWKVLSICSRKAFVDEYLLEEREGERPLSIQDAFHLGHTVSSISAYSRFEIPSGLSLGSWEQFIDLVGKGREE